MVQTPSRAYFFPNLILFLLLLGLFHCGHHFTVGGTVAGLDGTVVLQNNGGDDLTITEDGDFTFDTALDDGRAFEVTVSTQPATQTCSVSHGTGTISGEDVTNVTVTCSTYTYTVGGGASGLDGTVVLQNNGGDDLTLTEDGDFTFDTPVADGSEYEVTVSTQPATQTCSVSHGTGTISGEDVTNVTVICSTNTYTVGGSVSGLDGTVVLQNNGGDDLTLTEDGDFTFDTPIADGSDYEVSVSTQPAGQLCTVTDGAGLIDGANVTDVGVTCIDVKYLFITNTKHDGNFDSGSGGVVGADAFCNADANKPNDSTYKALLVDGVTRVACTTDSCSGGSGEHTDWPLAADTTYVRADGLTIIGTTNANGLFTFPLTHTFLLSEGGSESERIWTGLNGTWTSGASNCTTWTSNATLGQHGRIDATNTQAIAYSFQGCGDSNYLGCVEQ